MADVMIGGYRRPNAWKILVFVICMLVINLYAIYAITLAQRTQARILLAQSGIILIFATLRAFLYAHRVRMAAESGSSVAEPLQGLKSALVGVAIGIVSLVGFLRLL